MKQKKVKKFPVKIFSFLGIPLSKSEKKRRYMILAEGGVPQEAKEEIKKQIERVGYQIEIGHPHDWFVVTTHNPDIEYATKVACILAKYWRKLVGE